MQASPSFPESKSQQQRNYKGVEWEMDDGVHLVCFHKSFAVLQNCQSEMVHHNHDKRCSHIGTDQDEVYLQLEPGKRFPYISMDGFAELKYN